MIIDPAGCCLHIKIPHNRSRSVIIDRTKMLDLPIPTPACQKPIIKMLTGQMSPNYTLSDTSKRAQWPPTASNSWLDWSGEEEKEASGGQPAGR